WRQRRPGRYNAHSATECSSPFPPRLTHTDMPRSSAERAFIRGLGLWDATAVVAGSMIGSGIFIVSADIARQVGTPGWLLTVWLLTGLMTIIGALSYGELAGMMPDAGGPYVYLR